ncbi:hypothetical protein ACWGDT_33425 [Streptomyces avermitilis]
MPELSLLERLRRPGQAAKAIARLDRPHRASGKDQPGRAIGQDQPS